MTDQHQCTKERRALVAKNADAIVAFIRECHEWATTVGCQQINLEALDHAQDADTHTIRDTICELGVALDVDNYTPKGPTR